MHSFYSKSHHPDPFECSSENQDRPCTFVSWLFYLVRRAPSSFTSQPTSCIFRADMWLVSTTLAPLIRRSLRWLILISLAVFVSLWVLLLRRWAHTSGFTLIPTHLSGSFGVLGKRTSITICQIIRIDKDIRSVSFDGSWNHRSGQCQLSTTLSLGN